jgi:hypothetical protein
MAPHALHLKDRILKIQTSSPTDRLLAGTLLCVLILLSSTSILAQRAPNAPAWEATSHPHLETRLAQGEITIDGELDDAGWQGLTPAQNFAEHSPGDQTRPPVDTEVLVTYNDEFLYVAWVCYDDPAEVRATFTERDRIWNDDYVILALDTFASQGWAYEIAANPFGIQGDLLWSSNAGEDMTYDLIYYTSGRITDQGW